MSETKLIYVTAPSRAEAERIAEAAVKGNLAACANIFDGVTSIFRWEGKLCRENEAILILKTTKGRIEELIACIKTLHTYDCPCIAVVPIEDGNSDFLRWIQSATGSPADPDLTDQEKF